MSSPSTSRKLSTRRQPLPWRTEHYDDESVLRNLRKANPSLKWPVICEMYNEIVPASRRRSVDAIASKGKTLQREYRKSPAETSQTSPKSNLDSWTSLQNPVRENNSTWNVEMDPIGWDCGSGFDGLYNIVMDAAETKEAMCRRAMEAASGLKCSWEDVEQGQNLDGLLYNDGSRDYYDRERVLIDQVHHLNHQVAYLSAALQLSGMTAQNDRIALNRANAQLAELQQAFNELQVARAKLDNDIHEERQEHRLAQEALAHERLHHTETEKNLNCVWKAHSRLGEVVTELQTAADAARDVKTDPSVDVGKLIMELESKSLYIRNLEEAKQEAELGLTQVRENHEQEIRSHIQDSLAQKEIIETLHSLLEEKQSSVKEEKRGTPPIGEGTLASRRRKRNRGRAPSVKDESSVTIKSEA
ncbi:MAG: hypothetical protein Q9214_001893 [Letrouitia sp. 1 TL-2023]